MGIIISRFRKKKTTIEILEDIEKDINKLQKHRKENQDKQKRLATSLVLYSIVLYILSAIVFFLLYFPDTWPLRLLYSLPLLAFPFFIWGIKKLLHWYFVKRIAGNDLALRDLREKKKQILEDVMETETYKKAKEILEKFDPARFKKLERDEQTSPVSQAPPTPGLPGTALHQRKNVVITSQPPTPMPRSAVPTPLPRQPVRTPLPQRPPATAGSTPNPFINTPLRAPQRPGQSRMATPIMSMGRGRGGGVGGPPMQVQQQMMQAQSMPPQMARGYGAPGPPMPRSVLPRDRGMMDRMMDYLVGDGPENRYALVCRACHSHNGMALKEEFEYMSFRCCYCFVMNPARKQRPLAPRLEFFTPNARTVTLTKPEESNDDDDDDGDSSEYDSDDEATMTNKKGGDTRRKADSSSKPKVDARNNKPTAVTKTPAPPSSTTSSSSTPSSMVVQTTPTSSKTRNVQQSSNKSKLPVVSSGGAGLPSSTAATTATTPNMTTTKISATPGSPKRNVPSSSSRSALKDHHHHHRAAVSNQSGNNADVNANSSVEGVGADSNNQFKSTNTAAPITAVNQQAAAAAESMDDAESTGTVSSSVVYDDNNGSSNVGGVWGEGGEATDAAAANVFTDSSFSSLSLSASSLSNNTNNAMTTTTTNAITTQVEEVMKELGSQEKVEAALPAESVGVTDPSLSQQSQSEPCCDDEYEMIEAADGENGEDMMAASALSPLENKTPEKEEVEAEQEEDLSARSC